MVDFPVLLFSTALYQANPISELTIAIAEIDTVIPLLNISFTTLHSFRVTEALLLSVIHDSTTRFNLNSSLHKRYR